MSDDEHLEWKPVTELPITKRILRVQQKADAVRREFEKRATAQIKGLVDLAKLYAKQQKDLKDGR